MHTKLRVTTVAIARGARSVKPPVPLGPAITIAFSLVTLFVLGLAVFVPSAPAPTTPVPVAASAPPAAPRPVTPAASEPDPELNFMVSEGETVTVTKVIDGDTFAVGRRTIKVIGLDACPTSTSGGRQAAEFARNQLMDGRSVVLRRAPGFNKDSAGRELRIVEETAHGFDYGTLIVPFNHTRADPDAPGPSAYVDMLVRLDVGRDCSEPRDDTTTQTPAPSSSGDDDDDNYDPDVYVRRGDGGMPDGALTGGYCRKKWWC